MVNSIADLTMIPFEEGGRTEKGSDCWGIVKLALELIHGVPIPDYQDVVLNLSDDFQKRNKTFEQVKQITESGEMFEKVDEPQYGDVILITMQARPVHAGIVLHDNLMLHTTKESGVTVENYLEVKWKSRISGFYRVIKT